MSNQQLLNKAIECMKEAKSLIFKKGKPQLDVISVWEKRQELIEQAELYYLAIG